MLKNLTVRKHLEYYISFIAIQILGFVLVIMNSQNKTVETTLIILTSMIYAAWSIVHQYIHHNLSTKIVVEYVLIGVLGVSVSMFVFH